MAQNSSEQRFLADQAADARTAMRQTVQEMKQTLTKAADVRTCARLHPWIATGSAVAAGFVAGAVLSRLRSRPGESSPAGTNVRAEPDFAGHDPTRAKLGFLRATLGTALTGILQTLLQSFIAAAVVGTQVDQVQEEPRHGVPPRPESEPEMDTDAHGNP
jgi:hypothetical protein